MVAVTNTGAVEQRMVIHGVRWNDYVGLRDALDTARLRMTYCNGTLEVLRPSFTHELNKKTITRLVELYAFVRSVPLIGYGSTTFRLEARQRGAEPDACYCVGRQIRDGEFPDLVLEVLHTRPIVDKLEVYLGFEVPEVWLFKDGAFEIHRLTAERYQRIDRSERLPGLDLMTLARLAVRPDQDEALQELRKLL